MRRARHWLVILGLGAMLTAAGCEQVRGLIEGPATWQAHVVSIPARGEVDRARLVPRSVAPGEQVDAPYGSTQHLTLPGAQEVVLSPGATVVLGNKKTPSVEVLDGGVWVEASDAPLEVSLGKRRTLRLEGRVKIVRNHDIAELTLREGQATVRTTDEERALTRALPLRIEADGTLVELPPLHLDHIFAGQTREEPLGSPVRRLGELRTHRAGEVLEEPPVEHLKMEVRAGVHGPVAYTEVEETFANRGRVSLDATYTFALPPGAVLTRMAMKVGADNAWREGRIETREEAKRTWEAAKALGLQQAQLDQGTTARGELRLGSVPPDAQASVRIGYYHRLEPSAGGYRYAYPMGIAQDPIDKIGFNLKFYDVPTDAVMVSGYEAALEASKTPGDVAYAHVTMEEERFWAEGDFVVEVQHAERSEALSAQIFVEPRQPDDDAYMLLRVRPPLPLSAANDPDDVLLVFDTSYRSGEALLNVQRRLARAILTEMEAPRRVAALSCAEQCEVLGDGWTTAADATLRDALSAMEQGGAQNTLETLRAILEVAHARAAQGQGEAPPMSVVYVTDGHTSVGPLDMATIVDELAPAFNALGVRLHVVDPGGAANRDAQRLLARTLGGTEPVVLDPTRGPTANAWRVLERLISESLRDIEVHVSAPAEMIPLPAPPSLRSGEELLLYGRLPLKALQEDVPLEVRVTGQHRGQPWEWTSQLRPASWQKSDALHLPALWASEEIARLSAMRPDDPERSDALTIELSKYHSVLSPLTTWVVLESEIEHLDRRREHPNAIQAIELVRGDTSRAPRGPLPQVESRTHTLDVFPVEDVFATRDLPHGIPMSGEGPADLGMRGGSGSEPKEARAEPQQAAPAPVPYKTMQARRARNAPKPRARRRASSSVMRGPSPEEPLAGDDEGVEFIPLFGNATARPRRPTPRRPAPVQRPPELLLPVSEVTLNIDRRLRAGGDPRHWTSQKARSYARLSRDITRDRSRRDLRRRLIDDYAPYTGGRARMELEDWLEYDRLDPDALLFYSHHLTWAGEDERARVVLSGVIDSAPENVELQELLARGLLFSEQPARACAHLQSVRSLRERAGEYARSRAEAIPEPGVADCPLVSDLSALGVDPPSHEVSLDAYAPPSPAEHTLTETQVRITLRAPTANAPAPQLLLVSSDHFQISRSSYPLHLLALERSTDAEGYAVLDAIVEVKRGDDLHLYARAPEGTRAQVRTAGTANEQVILTESLSGLAYALTARRSW
ncbi:VIT domain-containing protein [Lujinxingia vulgaris]|nr:VIT domain-containing protein [Lujinxingia vulgaris]